MNALILVGHGSLRPASGAAMLRLAARLRERGAAPLVGAGFLNYSQPSFAAALARLVSKGARRVTVQPYFLVPGYFVHTVLPRLSAEAQLTHPHLVLRTSEPFGAHPALARLLIKRAEAAGAGAGAAIVLVAHGSPDATANRAVEAVAALAQAERPTAPVALAYLSLNEPDLPTAVAQLAATGSRQAVVVPYMLQLGGHVAEDLPALMAQIAACEPSLDIRLAEHLGYDPLLVDVILERIKE